MKFEFKPSENGTSHNDVAKYNAPISVNSMMHLICFKMPCIIMSLLVVIDLFSRDISIFLDKVIIVAIAFLIIWITYFLIKKKKKTKAERTKFKKFCDLDTTYYFTIDDNYLIRENEFSKIKVKLNKVIKVEVLKSTIILLVENDSTLIYIPIRCLPVGLYEFINIIKEKNNAIVINEYYKNIKKSSKRYIIVCIISIVLAIIGSFFIGKYEYENNFTTYNLKIQDELKREDFNDSYYYENKNLSLGIYFPQKWDGKYGIEELNDRINVYYLPNRIQSNKTTLLFSIVKLENFNERDELYISRVVDIANERYKIFSPKTISTLKNNGAEYKEYIDMYKESLALFMKSIE